MEETQSQQSSPAPVRKKTACAECRQQKMRCEGEPSNLDPPACSRCHRLKIPCVFSAPFKRTHKRRRLQELEEETSALKRQLLPASPAVLGNALPALDVAPRDREEDIDLSRIPVASIIRRKEPSTNSDTTLSRTIDGLELSPGMIDDCFGLYFAEYHPMLPLLDPSITPNTFYQHAPFLFWVIVAVGSRRYTRQPTLTQALALPVTHLALQSIIVRTRPMERIKGLILLINWPFPSGPFYRDPSFLLAGTLVHMAMQCGLHAPNFSQDFFKVYFKPPEQKPLRKAEIWAYVVITYQRTCTGSGQANLVSFDTYNEQTDFKALLEKLPTTLRVQMQISIILTRAQKALLDLGLLSMTPQQERTMDALLKGFNAELDTLEKPSLSVWDRLYISCARQDLAVMHFYKSAATLDMQSCLLIFDATSSVLEQLRDLDRDYGLSRTCTRFHSTVILLSLGSMARILKGPFAGYLDQIRGYGLFDAGARFARSTSVQRGDFGERSATFAEQLWKSKKVFRDPDGSINITLRVRNRLSGGPLHDVIRCWKEEFTDEYYTQPAPGTEIGIPFSQRVMISNRLVSANGGLEPTIPSSTSTGLDATLAPSIAPNSALSNYYATPDFLLNDEFWGDLGLGLNDTWDMAG